MGEVVSSAREDEIRNIILNYLYSVHIKARSRKSSRVSKSKIKKDLKQKGLKQQEIVRNLEFLIQGKWVKIETEESEFTTPSGFVKKQVKEYYRISDAGITFIEGASIFQNVEKSTSGINITNVHGVTVIGNQNIAVNSEYIDLYRALSLLSDAVRKSGHLSDEEKLNYTQDIETIKDQASKPSPDKNIIKMAWEKLKPLATVSGIVSFFAQAAALIAHLAS